MRLLSRHEVAKILGIGVSTLDKLVKQEKIQTVRFNRRVLFREADVENFIKKHTKNEKNNDA